MISPWEIKWIEVPITVGTSAYTANDVVGGTLSCAVPQRRGGCFIYAVKLIDERDQDEPFTLTVYKNTPSTIADGDPDAPTTADRLLWIGDIAIAAADYDTLGTHAALVYGLGGSNTGSFVHADETPGGNLYFRLRAGDTPDYGAANDLTLYVGLYLP